MSGPTPAPATPAAKAIAVPTVGRIVHVEGPDGDCLAAVVTRANGLTPDVQVFLPDPNEGGRFQATLAAAKYDDSAAPAAGTWHWPETA